MCMFEAIHRSFFSEMICIVLVPLHIFQAAKTLVLVSELN